MAVSVQIADFGSALQIQSIGLRYEVLRKPLGLIFNSEDLQKEYGETHIVACEGPLVAGCMILKDCGNGELKMRQVAVNDRFQAMGIGKSMVKFAEEFALKKGYTTITLHARESAIPFYTSLNYDITSDTFQEVGIPHKAMKKVF